MSSSPSPWNEQNPDTDGRMQIDVILPDGGTRVWNLTAEEIKARMEEGTSPIPIGTNAYGKVFQWAKGKALEAAKLLQSIGEGYVKGVFHNNQIGDIDLIWGNAAEDKGLDHIIQKHIQEHNDFSSLEDAMSRIDDIITNGVVKPGKNASKKEIHKDGYIVTLAMSPEGTWVLTAYDDTRKQSQKKNSGVPSATMMTAGQTPNDADSRAVESEASTVSTSKGSDNSTNSNSLVDFRGNPLPLRSKKFKDGTTVQVVDGDRLAADDPEAWAAWNEAQPVKAVDTRRQLENLLKENAVKIARQQDRGTDGRMQIDVILLDGDTRVWNLTAEEIKARMAVPENAESMPNSSESVPGNISKNYATKEEIAEMRSRRREWLSKEDIEGALELEREEIFEKYGTTPEPIAAIPEKYISLIGDNVTDNRVYSSKGYFIDHAVNHHSSVNINDYDNIDEVLDNPDDIKEKIFNDGKRTVIFVKKFGKYNAVAVQLETTDGGKIIWHKTFFSQTKEPYANLKSIKPLSEAQEGGVSSIIRNDSSLHGSSLSARYATDKGSDNSSNSNSLVDFRGNPLPLRTKKFKDGTTVQVVDGDRLAVDDPEAWAAWNEAQPVKAVDTRRQLENLLKENADKIARQQDRGGQGNKTP